MAFLGNLLPAVKTKSNNTAAATARAVGVSYGPVGNMGVHDVDRSIAVHYERVLWVFAAVNSIATKLMNLEIVFRQGGRGDDAQETLDPDLDRILNRKANGYETGKKFRYRLYSLLLLSTKGVFLEIVRSESGGIAELHILPPGRVEPIPDPNTYVSGYRVTGGEEGVEILRPEQVLWIKLRPHPTDAYRQMTPLMAAGLAADTDFLARVFNRNFLQNDGRPGMLVTVQDLQPQDADILRSRFNGGVSAAGNTVIIEGNGIDIADMSTSPRDAMWTESLSISRDDIMTAFGVPMIALGSSNEKTFDNADAESVSYWTETLVPIADGTAEEFDRITPGGVDDDIFVVHDTSKIFALQAVVREKKKDMQAEILAGVRTINSYLKETGEDEVDDPMARVFLIPPGMVAVGAQADIKAAMERMAAAAPAAGLGPAQTAPIAPGKTVRQLPSGQSRPLRQLATTQQSQGNTLRQLTKELENRAKPATRPRQASSWVKRPRGHKSAETDQESDRKEVIDVDPRAYSKSVLEGRIVGLTQSWIDRQIITTAERLTGVKARKGTRHWTFSPEEKATTIRPLDVPYVINQQRWIDEITTSLQQVVREAVKTEIQNMLDNYGVNNADIDMTSVVTAISERVTREAVNQSQAVESLIAEAEDRGDDMETIKNRVKNAGRSGDWISDFAHDVTNQAVEGTRAAVADRIGGLGKTWHTLGDDRVRASHRRLNGRTIRVSHAFTSNGVKLRYPHDPLAPIGETAGCRCFITYSS